MAKAIEAPQHTGALGVRLRRRAWLFRSLLTKMALAAFPAAPLLYQSPPLRPSGWTSLWLAMLPQCPIHEQVVRAIRYLAVNPHAKSFSWGDALHRSVVTRGDPLVRHYKRIVS